MKKIQKSILMLAALLMAGAAFTSCTNESDPTADAPKPAEGKYFMTVYATWSNDATRAVAFDETNNVLKSTWAQGDEVLVYEKVNSAINYIGTLTAQSSGAATLLTGEVEAANNGDYRLITKPKGFDVNDPLSGYRFYYTGQTGTLEGLSDYDYANTKITATDIDGFNINVKEAIFTNQQSMVKFTLLDEEGNAILVNKLSIDKKINDPGEDDLCTEFEGIRSFGEQGIIDINLTTPSSTVWAAIRDYNNNTNGTINLTAYTATGMYTFTKTNMCFGIGKYYPITVKMHENRTRLDYITQSAQTWQVND